MTLQGKNDKKNSSLEEVTYIQVGDKGFTRKRDVKLCDTWFLYFTIVTAILTWFVGGTTIVWASPAIVKLQSDDINLNPLGRPITTVEISMMLGIPGIISLLGSSFLPKLADLIGRKKCLQVTGMGMLLSMLGLAFSNSLSLIILFYSLVVTVFSGLLGILPMYVTEICENHNRAKYGCLMSVCLPFGQLYAYSIGPFFSIKDYTLLLVAPIIPFLVLFSFAPESPVYGVKTGRKEECLSALRKLRSNKTNKELEADFKMIKQNLEVREKRKGISLMKLFMTKEGRTGVMLAMLPMLTQFLSGVPVLLPLMAPIFNQSGSSVSGNTIAIFVGIVKLCVFTLTFLLVERTGRKPLLIISATAAGVCMLILGVFFYLKHVESPIASEFQWVPLVCILLYFTSYSLGLGSIPIAMISVFFPMDLRSTANSFIITTTNLLVTLYLAIYPLLAEAIGTHWCMYIFAFTCFVGAFLMYVMLPETRGKSTAEIQNILKNY